MSKAINGEHRALTVSDGFGQSKDKALVKFVDCIKELMWN
jgi:hypothetical protein